MRTTKNVKTLLSVLFLCALFSPSSASARWELRRDGEQDLFSIWGQGQALLAVGAKGTILRSLDRGRSWEQQASNTQEPLYSIWGDDARLFIAGGNTLLRSDDQGQSWHATNLKGERGSLRSVWGDGRSIFAVGDAGVILASSDAGASWRREKSGTSLILHSLCGGSKKIFAVGEAGVILRSEGGGAWQAINSGTSEILRSCWMSPRGTVYVVGYQGVLLRSDDQGETWTSLTTNTTEWLVGVSGVQEQLIAVGAKGVLLTSNAETILRQESNTSRALYGVWASSSQAFVVGKGGLILGLTPPTLQLAPFDESAFGAEVFIDQVKIGVLPLSQELTVGQHTLSIQKEGFQPYSEELSLSLGEDRRLSISLLAEPLPENQPALLAPLELPALRVYEPPPPLRWPPKLYRGAAITASASLLLGALGVREARLSAKFEEAAQTQLEDARLEYQRHQAMMRGFGISADLLGGASLLMVSVALYPKLFMR